MEPADVAFLSQNQIDEMNDSELLEAIWALESLFKGRGPQADHRRHLGRSELEHIFCLIQSLARGRVRRSE
jgi:hypothetical protein